MKRVRIPLELIGNKRSGNSVCVWNIIRGYNWAPEDQPHIETSFYDPNSVHHWILEQCSLDSLERAKPLVMNKAVGIEYDYTQKPCPDEVVFNLVSE
jgi:hypothetical protein